MATRWLTPREMRAWRAYIESYADLTNALEHDLAPHGMTLGDYQVLVYLSEADGRSMRMRDLAELLQLSPSGLTRRLDGLVTAGWVVREPSEDDRRVMRAVLTPDGFAALERTAPAHLESVRRHVFDRLDDDQVDAMASIFESLCKGFGHEPWSDRDHGAGSDR